MIYNESDIQRILTEELEALKRRISDNIESTGLKASGKTQASMEVEVKGTSGLLTGRQAFSTLERGASPWTKRPRHAPKWFVDIIQQWIIDKNLEEQLNAWAVATTIIHKGTALHRGGGRADVYSPEIETALKNIGTRLDDYFVTLVTDSLVINHEPTKI